ncbi:EVE domain containing protein [Pyrenophora tritici-repentis]|nr:EVE domain-containing protein [Pyrenophora tritici-repentis]KAI0610062.1 EVE domain-containing protein [Pyrenophora tritici-repentis]PZD31142.1 EVE domain containing protein [Pyrenophora tritici-repentis]
MAGTRRSTRQTASTAPKYNEDDSSAAEDKTNSKLVEDSPPPNKKAATSKAKKSRAKAPATTTSTQPESSTPNPTVVSAPSSYPSSSSNRHANGNQEVYWLLKAEPLPRYENGVNVAFSISDLRACTKPEPWGGVRNPQARNNMQAMRKDDLGFFYHSNAKPSGVVGILRVVEEAKVDETAFDPKDPYYDKKSDPEKPKWFCVGVEFVKEFEKAVDLHKIKEFAKDGGPLKDMQLVTNSRLSVCKVRKEEWDFIMGLAEGKKGDGGEDAHKASENEIEGVDTDEEKAEVKDK